MAFTATIWGSPSGAGATTEESRAEGWEIIDDFSFFMMKKFFWGGHLGGSVVECLPSVQVVILRSWDQVPHQGTCFFLCLCLWLSLCVSHE